MGTKLKYAVCGDYRAIAWFFGRADAEEYAAWLCKRGRAALVVECRHDA
ncbi:MAG: hypothetical protein RSB04_11855 [Gordonibacter sp.]